MLKDYTHISAYERTYSTSQRLMTQYAAAEAAQRSLPAASMRPPWAHRIFYLEERLGTRLAALVYRLPILPCVINSYSNLEFPARFHIAYLAFCAHSYNLCDI